MIIIYLYRYKWCLFEEDKYSDTNLRAVSEISHLFKCFFQKKNIKIKKVSIILLYIAFLEYDAGREQCTVNGMAHDYHNYFNICIMYIIINCIR